MNMQRHFPVTSITLAVLLLTVAWTGFVYYQEQKLADYSDLVQNEQALLQQEIRLAEERIILSKQLVLDEKAALVGPSAVYAVLKETADRHGLTITEVSMQQTLENNPFILKLTGNYGNAIGFLSSLSAQRGFRMLRINMERASIGSEDSLQLTLGLVIPATEGAK